MASVKLELVRSIYADLERGDFSSAEWAHPAIEFVNFDGPDPTKRTGVAGMSASWGSILAAWEELGAVAEEYCELDDERVLVLHRWRGRRKTSGLEVEEMRTKAACLFHVCDGNVARLVCYWDAERALIEYDIPRRILVAPLHTHSREDEYTYVVAGTIGTQIGEEKLLAGPGRLLAKPRGVPHTLWNPGDTRVRVLELIVPGGFERCLEQLQRPNASRRSSSPGDLDRLWAEYGIEMQGRLRIRPPPRARPTSRSRLVTLGSRSSGFRRWKSSGTRAGHVKRAP